MPVKAAQLFYRYNVREVRLSNVRINNKTSDTVLFPPPAPQGVTRT